MTFPSIDRTRGCAGQDLRDFRLLLSRVPSPQNEDQRGGDGSEAGDRAQDLALALQGFVAGDMACNRGIELGELVLDEGQAHLALAFQDRIELHMAAVAQAGALLDQCRPCHLQVFEHKQVLRIGRNGSTQGGPPPGQDA